MGLFGRGFGRVLGLGGEFQGLLLGISIGLDRVWIIRR
jgi:hypothetical protein